MKANFAGRGTLFNFATVLLGALIGLLLKSTFRSLDEKVFGYVPIGLGLVTLGIGIKLFLGSKSVLIVAFSIALGGLIGAGVGIHSALEQFGQMLQERFGGDSTFATGMLLTTVLFCVGPMTLLGCIEDALERKIELLGTKAIMDGFSAIIFAFAFGSGVVATAFILLVFQGALTLLAGSLKGLARDEEAMAELSGSGGAVLLATGLNLLNAAEIQSANFLPSLALAPITVLAWRALTKRLKKRSP